MNVYGHISYIIMFINIYYIFMYLYMYLYMFIQDDQIFRILIKRIKY